MILTQTVRRTLFAATIVGFLVLFFKSFSSPIGTPAPVVYDASAEKSNDGSPSRPDPPPGAADSTAQRTLQSAQEVASRPIRDRLEYHFPYDMQSKFPAFIWQTWKKAPGMAGFDERLRPLEATWSEKHPGFVHQVITDDAALHLISYLYASIPEVVEAYEAMPLPVLKADFFRYLILLARGGIYSDIDTSALKPTTEWLPADFDRHTVGLIVGIEADPDRKDWAKWYARRIQFCQWTMQSKPGHPVLRDVVATITEDTLRMKKNKELRQGSEPEKSIMEFTGPGMWTDAIFNYFNNEEYFDFSARASNISYPDFFAMKQAKQVGDVIILPITSFSPGVGQMGAGDTDHKMAFVKHEFDGSWKPDDEKKVHD